MATTIKLKNGSGAPTAGQLVQGEPALDLTNKRLYTEDSGGTVIEVGSNPTSLTTPTINNSTGVSLQYNGSTKAATTSTGIDVTGTVVADGLTVDGNATLSSAEPRLIIAETDATDLNTRIRNTTGKLQIQTLADDLAVATNRLQIDHATGDISFYEDTGTTAKFFWDASAESLELSSGTSYVTTNSGKAIGGLDIQGAYNGSGTYGAGISLGTGGTGRSAIAAVSTHATDNDANGLAFFVHGSSGSTADSTEVGRWDGNGNLLVGKTTANTFNSTAGHEQQSNGLYANTRDGGIVQILNRLTSDGDIAVFRKDGTTVGSIYTDGGYLRIFPSNGVLRLGRSDAADYLEAIDKQGSTQPRLRSNTDGTYNLGESSSRFKDLYLSGGILSGGVTSNESVAVSTFGYDPTADWGLAFKATAAANGTAVIFRSSTSSTIGTISTTTTSTAYNTSSDYRLKENVVPMDDAASRVLALKPCRFNFIADPDNTVDGFLAHEAQEVVPEAVHGVKDGMRTEEYEVSPAVLDDEGNVVTEAVMGTREVPDYQGIDQSKLVPLLTKALQEALERIAALEAKVG